MKLNLPPTPDDLRFRGNEVHLVASAAASLDAARREAEQAGIAAHVLPSSVEGEASVVGTVHAALVREMRERGRPFPLPSAILSGGGDDGHA